MIKVYSRASCPFCRKLISLLDSEKIEYQNIDIGKNPEFIKGIISRDDNTPIPQVEVKGRIIFDYVSEESLVEEIKSLIN